MGHDMKACKEPQKQLVRKFVHCYGPATADRFADWLGCSGKQGRRMWNLIAEELEPVTVSGKKPLYYLLTENGFSHRRTAKENCFFWEVMIHFWTSVTEVYCCRINLCTGKYGKPQQIQGLFCTGEKLLATGPVRRRAGEWRLQ